MTELKIYGHIAPDSSCRTKEGGYAFFVNADDGNSYLVHMGTDADRFLNKYTKDDHICVYGHLALSPDYRLQIKGTSICPKGKER